jgi:gamma-glutamyltranspeptidase/glutathione hydrolase
MRKSSAREIACHLAALFSIATGACAHAQSQTPFAIPTVEQAQPTKNSTAIPGSRAQGWLAQGRSEVLARHGMVATSDPLASQAGLDVLRTGGNAIDAAVAAAAVLDVTSQNDTSIGGDLFAIVWSARDHRLYALNAAGRAPAAWTPAYFRDHLNVTSVPFFGVNAVTVPGAVAGYDALLRRFGTFGFRGAFERAAQIAEEGWGLAERRHADLLRVSDALREDPDSRQVFLDEGRTPPLYGIIRNPNLAKALRLLQAKGRDAFYKGDIAAAIVRKVQGNGGAMTLDDLSSYEPDWVETVSTNYHGYDIHELPPPGQGFAALEMLNIVEVCAPRLGIDLATLGPADPLKWHLLVEAKKLAYSDLLAYDGDPKFSPVPVTRLISKDYAATRCDHIDRERAGPVGVVGGTDGGTVYLATADRWGNMVSLVHSVFSVYGSRATVGPYGFVLHNRGAPFSLEPGHPNEVAPGKQPFHSIMAAFIMRDGEPLMALGNMGGSVQPEAHAQHIVNLIDHGMNVQMTSDAARFTHDQNTNVLSLEQGLFAAVGKALESMGHVVRSVDGSAVGGYQGILFTRDPRLPPPIFDRRSVAEDRPVNGVFRAGSDHRKDGQAVGW